MQLKQSLNDQKVGFEGIIDEFAGEDFQIFRLQELGFVRGEKIRINGRTSFGDPYVSVRDVSIALRADEAQCIKVKM